LREEEPPGIHTVEDILRKFPEYDGEHHKDDEEHSRDLDCQDCHAVFFSRADRDYHQQTSLCQDSAAVAYVLISDTAQPGGYRVERRLLPFDVSHSRIKCPKCKQSFATQDELESHQASHVMQHLECVHCQRLFHTVTELESHYDWHDDMEFRHHRNKIRAKQPGLKLLSELGYRDQTKVAVPTFKRQSMFPGPAKPMPVIHEAASAVTSDLGML
jgi:phage FluMu protein Com